MGRRQGKPYKPTGTRRNRGRIRNHVIPKAHMRRFAVEDLVYTFDFTVAQGCRSYRPPRQNVNNATVIRGFYTDEYEKNLSQKFEDGVKEIADKIIGEQQLALDERIRLSRYIYAYRARSPWMLHQLQSRYQPDMRDILQEFSRQLSFVQASLYDMDRPIDEDFFKEMRTTFESRENELNDAQTVQADLQFYFSEGSQLTTGPQHTDRLLASLPWRVFVSAGQPFVLGPVDIYGLLNLLGPKGRVNSDFLTSAVDYEEDTLVE